jgi:hypothetical protein
MSKHHSRARGGEGRASLYNEITDKIIAELKAGRIPWVQPWGTAAAKAPLAMPRNAATSPQYGGINILILWGSVIEKEFAGQSWLTFRQALTLGGHVRKGERGTTVVYADRFVPAEEKRRGTGLSSADFLRPGNIAQVGLDAGRPILDSISGLMGYVSFFENFFQIAVLLFAWIVVLLAFFILAIQLFITLIAIGRSYRSGPSAKTSADRWRSLATIQHRSAARANRPAEQSKIRTYR